MKKIFTSFVFVILTLAHVNGQGQSSSTRFLQITTIESIYSSGGVVRSKMIISKEDGTQEEKDMENLFSRGAINVKKLRENETTILQTLRSYTDNGWKLVSTTALTLNPGESTTGLFMTRYLFSKEEAKK